MKADRTNVNQLIIVVMAAVVREIGQQSHCKWELNKYCLIDYLVDTNLLI